MAQTDPVGDHPEVAHAKTTRRKQARPSELVAAALDLFVEKGYAATRAEEVATRAGVSKGTLFLYFASKEELFKAVVRETVVPAIGDAAFSAARGPLARSTPRDTSVTCAVPAHSSDWMR